MSNKELLFIILGTKDSVLTQLFCNEFENYFKVPDYMNVQIVFADKEHRTNKNLANFLASTQEEYVILHQDDMIFYDNIDVDMFNYYFQILKHNSQFVCLRLSRGGMSEVPPAMFANNICYIQDNELYPFSMFYTIWKKDVLISLLNNSPTPEHTTELFKINKLKGLMAYSENHTKRGLYHWENNSYPFMNTAVINGQWNIQEYGIEIENLKREYGVES